MVTTETFLTPPKFKIMEIHRHISVLQAASLPNAAMNCLQSSFVVSHDALDSSTLR